MTSSTGSSFQQKEWVALNGNSRVEIIETGGGGNIVFTKTDFKAYELVGGWTYDSRNRALFADRGAKQRLAFSVTGPGSEVEFYTVRYDWEKYWPIKGQWGLKWRGETSYGKEFGNTTALPPYKRFFGGGPNSVRGFKEGRMGPFDSFQNPYGGNAMVASQMELLVPIPEKFQGKSRASLFYDVGNVFSTDSTRFFAINDQGNVVPEDFGFDLNSMKHSVGVAAEWLSPMGVFRFSYGIPLNDDEKDEIEKFQCSVGSAF